MAIKVFMLGQHVKTKKHGKVHYGIITSRCGDVYTMENVDSTGLVCWSTWTLNQHYISIDEDYYAQQERPF